jgi:hypothetical protein
MNQKIQVLSAMAVLIVVLILCSGCSSAGEKSSQVGNSTSALGVAKITQSPATPLTSPQTKSKIIDPNILFNYFPPAPSGWTMSNTFVGEVQAIPGLVGAERIYRNPSKTNSYIKITILCSPNESYQGDISPTQGCQVIDIAGNSALICNSDTSPWVSMFFKKRCSISSVSVNIIKTEYVPLINSIDFKGLSSIL